jgi:hypothetical protein
LTNIQEWIHYALYESSLALSEISIQYCKNIIGLINGYGPAFDFIAKERDIPNAKASYIKTLVISRNNNEMQTVFAKLSKHIPEPLSAHLRKMLNGSVDTHQIIAFILKYLEMTKSSLDWNKVDNFSKLLEKDQAVISAQTKYLKDLF